jgi:hypothetical protein
MKKLLVILFTICITFALNSSFANPKTKVKSKRRGTVIGQVQIPSQHAKIS